MEPRLTALLIFVAAYALFVALPARRSWVAVICSALAVLTGALTPSEAFDAVNWNVMGVFLGTLVMADLFIESRMPAYLAERIVSHSGNTCLAILFICALTGFISAFVENVATVMIIAPIAFSLARKLDINPVKPLIAISVSANLQGAATLIGDPPSMMLAGYAGMNFLDFFVCRGKPSIFFAVQIGAVVSLAFLYLVFRKEPGTRHYLCDEKVRVWFPSFLLMAVIVALAMSSFVDPGFDWLAGVLCLCGALVGCVWDVVINKGTFLRRIRRLDWDTTFFLIGVFILVGAITATGWTEIIAEGVASSIGGNVLVGFVLLVIMAMTVSAFVDNVPFFAAMMPVVLIVSRKLSLDPTLFLFGLLLGASIGGNITPIGATANIVCVGLLKKQGYNVTFLDFMKIGLPFTIVAMAASCVFIWFVWGP